MKEENDWAGLLLAELILQCPNNKMEVFMRGGELRRGNVSDLLGGSEEAEQMRKDQRVDCRRCIVWEAGYEHLCLELHGEYYREDKVTSDLESLIRDIRDRNTSA